MVVISAMGDTTDELMDLALQVSPLPPPRELDMLLTAGERMSAALLAMAIHDQGMHARSLTGSQAGIITTGTHGNARIIDITPGRITNALDQDDIVIVAGFQGVAQDTKDVTTLGRGASDTTAVALAASLGADYCEIYTDVDGVFTADPRIVPSARRIPRHQLRGDAGDGRLRRQDPASALRGVRAARERPGARALVVLRPGRHLGAGTRGRKRDGTGDHLRRRPRPQRGQDHHRRRARPGGRGGPDLHGGGRDRDQHRHDRAERVGGGDLADRHLLHPAQDRRTGGDGDAGRAEGEVGFTDVLYDDQIGKVSVVGVGMRSHPGVTAKFFSALAEAGVNIEMISTSEIRISVVVDQDDVDRAVAAAHTAFGLDAAEAAVVYAGTGR